MVAFIIDCLTLGIACMIVGFMAGDALAALGAWGRIVGGFIGVVYFGIGASSAFGGQTLGKKLMSIAVRRRDGSTLTLASALGRATLLMLPIACNGLALGMQWTAVWVTVSAIVFLLGGATTYLFLFNRRTREAAHDLLTRSVVMRLEAGRARSIDATVWPKHFVIFGAICLASTIAVVAFMMLDRSIDWAGLKSAQMEIAHLAKTDNVSVVQGWGWYNGSRSTWIRITATTYTHPSYPERLASAIAETALHEIPAARSRSQIIVVIVEGYDIVFATSTHVQGWTDSPAEWQKRISDSGGLPVN
jgi:uncharacterized RDD family membrane protein YckC